MATSAPLSSAILDGDGAGAAPFLHSLPDFSPYPVSSTGLPMGLDPGLLAGYVVLFPLFDYDFSYSLISFLIF